MDRQLLQKHRLTNLAQSTLMLFGLASILGFVGWSFGGWTLMFAMLVSGAIGLWFAPKVSTSAVLNMYNAKALDSSSAPALIGVMKELARRAELSSVPRLYYIPSQLLNAFAVGSGRDAAVAVTDGLLRKLGRAELVGVLAHEVSHIQNNDVRVMGMADILGRLTHSFSLIGQFLLLLNLPMIILGQTTISWFAIAALIFAPQLSALLQLGLSRTREFDADRGAAELTGDPASLAEALRKLDLQGRGIFERIFMPNRRSQEPSLLRTHPPTEDRISRLMQMEGRRYDALTHQEHLDLSDWLSLMSKPSGPRNHYFRGLRF